MQERMQKEKEIFKIFDKETSNFLGHCHASHFSTEEKEPQGRTSRETGTPPGIYFENVPTLSRR